MSVLLGQRQRHLPGTADFRHRRLTPVAGWCVGDVNGDGKPDSSSPTIYLFGGNTVSVLLGNGNGTFQAQQTFATGV